MKIISKVSLPAIALVVLFATTYTHAATQEVDLITNGGFESGTIGWTLSGAVITSGGNQYNGTQYAVLGEIDGATDLLSQAMTVPANAGMSNASFYYYIYTEEPLSTVYDVLDVTLEDLTTGTSDTIANLSNKDGGTCTAGRSCYKLASKQIDLSSKVGHSIQYRFRSKLDADTLTSFKIDDVKLLVQVTTSEPLVAPSKTTATTLSASSIALVWQDNSGAEGGFYVERKTGAGTYSRVKTIPAMSGTGQGVQTEDSGLQANTPYCYRIQTYDNQTTSTYSNEACATTLQSAQTVPTVVTGSATNITTTGTTLNGTINPIGIASGGFFQWGLSTGFGNQTSNDVSPGASTSPMPISAILSGLSPATTYYYRIVGANAQAGSQVFGETKNFNTAQGTVTTACTDGIDNDGDGEIDYPSDPGCMDVSDSDEVNSTPPPTGGTPVAIQTGYYIGNGTTLDISGVGFSPDFVILKADNTAGSGSLFKTSTMSVSDTAILSGAFPNNTAGAVTLASDGFRVTGTMSNVANSRYTWIAVAGSDCTTSGSFCVGTYTGNDSSSRALESTGFSPDFVMVKATTAMTPSWRSASMPNNVGQFFSENSQNTTGDLFTTLDATGFSIGASNNKVSTTYHFVAFQELPGIIDVGVYTGDAIDNRSIAGVGFVPDFLLIKNSNAALPAVYNLTESYGDSTSHFTDTSNIVDAIQALQTDGFQVGKNAIANGLGNTMYFAALGGASDARTTSGSVSKASGSYVGTGIAHEVGGIGWTPDLVIIKASNTQKSVFRTSLMAGDITAFMEDAKVPFAGGISALTNSGFTIGTYSDVNSAGVTYDWEAYGNAWRPDRNTGAKDFVIGAYSGSGIDNRDITRLPFLPDAMTIKAWSSSAGVFRTSKHVGDSSTLYSTGAVQPNHIQRFNEDGFQIGTSANVNLIGASGVYNYFAFSEKQGDPEPTNYIPVVVKGVSVMALFAQPTVHPKLLTSYQAISGDKTAQQALTPVGGGNYLKTIQDLFRDLGFFGFAAPGTTLWIHADLLGNPITKPDSTGQPQVQTKDGGYLPLASTEKVTEAEAKFQIDFPGVLTASVAKMTALMDHSSPSPFYKDHVIVTTNDKGEKLSVSVDAGVASVRCYRYEFLTQKVTRCDTLPDPNAKGSLWGYAQDKDRTDFSLNKGFAYHDDMAASNIRGVLWYDGHPGYDFGGGGNITAPQDGVVCAAVGRTTSTSDQQIWRDVKKCPYKETPNTQSLKTPVDWDNYHVFYIMHEDGNGEHNNYVTWYLHANNFTTDIERKMKRYGYASTTRGTNIAVRGGWGVTGAKSFPPHLHFEMSKNTVPIDPYGFPDKSGVLWTPEAFEAQTAIALELASGKGGDVQSTEDDVEQTVPELLVKNRWGESIGNNKGVWEKTIPFARADSSNVLLNNTDPTDVIVRGVDTQGYNLMITRYDDKNTNRETVVFDKLSLLKGEVHQYAIDWQALEDKEATPIELSIDKDGDGTPEQVVDIGTSYSDTIAPTTTPTFTGTLITPDTYLGTTTLTLTTEDNEGGVGVEKTEYSFDGETWHEYTTPVEVTEEGTHTISYRSTDWFGNVEETKSVTFTIIMDDTPPVTTLSTAGTGNDPWFRSDITVTLTATDDKTGVASTTYSLDNGTTWLDYSAPFTLTGEGKHTVLHRSTDKAGNTEDTKTATLYIDLTAPEARVSANILSKDLLVVGKDNMGSATVLKTTTGYTITDEAGHTTKLTFKKTWNGKVLTFAQLIGIQYDSAPAATLPKTQLLYVWTPWRGVTSLTNQTVHVNKTFTVNATYLKPLNRTIVTVSQNGKAGSKQTFPGLKLVTLTTAKGVVGYEL
ncbi:MAG: hypothetical protein KBD24_00255 [Candidatus Pacebacteria bacterium]|nr:hypothetical protein [Candidatus Paceibacterota bacterium]